MTMKRNIFLQSTLRQPVRTIFLFLLFGLISFAFVSRATEYLVIVRETDRLGSYYRSIGRLVKPGLYAGEVLDVTPGAEVVGSSGYVAYEDRIRQTSGVIQGFLNADFDGTDAENSSPYSAPGVTNSDFWFYAALTSREELTTRVQMRPPDIVVGYLLTFGQVDKVLAGYPERIMEGSTIRLAFYFDDHEDAIQTIEAMEEGQRYLIRGTYDWFLNYTTNLKLYYNLGNKTKNNLIRPLDDAGLWYIAVRPEEEVDFTDPALAYVKNELEILQENTHALEVYTTTDMSAMPDVQYAARDMFDLVEGRWPNHQDDLEGNKVIVITTGLASHRKLKVGDTITLKFRPLKDPYSAFIQTEGDRQNWREYPTAQETFEIVGVFDNNRMPIEITHLHNWVYIPNSTLPAGYEFTTETLPYSRYSFVLKSPRDQDVFLAETREELAELGLTAIFMDNNGKAFWAGVDPLRQSTLTGLIIFSLVLFVSMILAIFLFLTQRQRDYAILRAMGMPKSAANRQLLFSIAVIGLPAILTGGIPAWYDALSKVKVTLAGITGPAGMRASAEMPPLYLAALCAGIFLVLLAIAWPGIQWMARRPVLELLQGEGAQVPKAGKTDKAVRQPLTLTEPEIQRQPDVQQNDLPHDPSVVSVTSFHTTANQNARALAFFGLRQTLRSRVKSMLAIAVAAGFVLALGWMQRTQEETRTRIDRLYDTTVIEGEIVQANAGFTTYGTGIIPRQTVDELLALGFIQEIYLEGSGLWEIVGGAFDSRYETRRMEVRGVYEPDIFFSDTLPDARIEYAPGWDENLFTEKWTEQKLEQEPVPTIFPDDWMERLGLGMGDRISFLSYWTETTHSYLVAGKYSGAQPTYYETLLVPGKALEVMDGDDLRYAVARFTIDPARNRELAAYKAKAEEIVSQADAGSISLQIVFWDEELSVVVVPLEKSLALLRLLYPVTVAVSALIAAGLCILLVNQSAKESAILRVLGATRGRVRALFNIQQLLLSLTGVLAGLLILILLRRGAGVILSGPVMVGAGLYLAGAFIGSLIGAVSVTNKKPLELLQVKE